MSEFKLTLAPLEDRTDLSSLSHQSFDDEGEFYFWLITSALKEQELQLGRTWVLSKGEELLGFFTTRLGTYTSDAKGVYLLAKLAVVKKYQRKGFGFGKYMLAHCVRQAKDILKITACVGVMAYSKENAVGFYVKYGFAQVLNRQLLLRSDKFDEALEKMERSGE